MYTQRTPRSVRMEAEAIYETVSLSRACGLNTLKTFARGSAVRRHRL